MSSSHPAHTKVMFLDSETAVKEKIAGAACLPGTVQGNGVLPIVEHILIPVSEIKMLHLESKKENGVNGHHVGGVGGFAAKGAPDGTLFSIPVSVAAGDDHPHLHYGTYQDLEGDYIAGEIHPAALKDAVADALNQLLQPIRDLYDGDDEWKLADQRGYPEDWLH